MTLIKGAPARVNDALTAVIMARAKWQTVNEVDQETKLEILTANDFREEDSGERITKINADFLMSEADFEQYCELVYRRNLEKGLDSGGVNLNFWPVQKAVYEAEDAFIDIVTADIPQYTPELIKTVKRDHKPRAEFLKISGL